MTGFPDSEFWGFSLAVYGTADVAPACLDLQERFDLDVNVLLFAAWIGASGRGRLSSEDGLELASLVENWHRDVVRYLRHLRVALRPGYDGAPEALVQSLRRRIQKVEIDAEHIEQVMLDEWAAARTIATGDAEARLTDAFENMIDYTRAHHPVGAAEREKLTIIRDACRGWLAERG